MEYPSTDIEKELNSLIGNKPDIAFIRKKKYKVKWLHPVTTRFITDLSLKDGNDDTLSYKVCAAIILNGFFRLKLFHWILWRWFFYIRQYDESDLTDIIALGKKKIPLSEYYTNIILATDMKDTAMMMKKGEVYSFRQGQSTAQAGNSQKTTAG